MKVEEIFLWSVFDIDPLTDEVFDDKGLPYEEFYDTSRL